MHQELSYYYVYKFVKHLGLPGTIFGKYEKPNLCAFYSAFCIKAKQNLLKCALKKNATKRFLVVSRLISACPHLLAVAPEILCMNSLVTLLSVEPLVHINFSFFMTVFAFILWYLVIKSIGFQNKSNFLWQIVCL